MLVVISPAKRLDWTERGFSETEPQFARDAATLASLARQLSLAELKSLMNLSDGLARLNRERFRAFKAPPDDANTRPALYAFAGDTFQGFDANSLDDEGRDRAQRHLRILSGLYGVLRPMDAIQPYRLEMGCRLKTRRGTKLYDFWGSSIARGLNEAACETGADVLVNCASLEYFRAVDLGALKSRVITPVFYEVSEGISRIVSVHAKRARGAMARFIVDNRVTTEAGLRDFDLGGYRFVRGEGDGTRLVFQRERDMAERAA